MPSRILIVEDDRSTAEDLQDTLTELGYEVAGVASSAGEALLLAQRSSPDLVLMDVRLEGDMDGSDAARALGEQFHIPTIFLTAHVNREMLQRAKRAKPLGHLVKPFQDSELQASIEIALHRPPQELANAGNRIAFGKFSIVTESEAMRRTLDHVIRVAHSNSPAVLIEGDSGTGKELLAQVLHSVSDRQQGSFVPVTCSAIPENLIESELFGHERGAFPEALTQKKGLFQIADHGTLFLDEIRDLTPAIQAKILRVVEEGAFRRLGSIEDIPVNVRVIAATDLVDPDPGEFRLELFHRPNVVKISLPALRERREDILPLARHFIDQIHPRHRPRIETISEDAAQLLLDHSWPGNVRELRNVIERALQAEDSKQLRPSSIHFVAMPAKKTHADAEHEWSLKDSERALVVRALEKTGGNQTRAAKLLGITRDMLRYRMKKMRLRSGQVLDMDATP